MSNKEQNVTSNIETEIVKSNRILSLSGGGVKGIAELVVLAEIEERTGKYITELFPIIFSLDKLGHYSTSGLNNISKIRHHSKCLMTFITVPKYQ